MQITKFLIFIIAAILSSLPPCYSQSKKASLKPSWSKESKANNTVPKGTLLTEVLTSKILEDNRINLESRRNVKVFLPPNYHSSGKSYPVVYFFHNIFWNPDKMFEDGKVVELMEKGFSNGVVKEFILVAADFSTPNTGSLYENSPVSGRWIDFIIQELVPFIDTKFRTIPDRKSRAATGEFMGGRGALKLAMVHAEVFSVVYALHPVATGNGSLPYSYLSVDWKKLHQARNFKDLDIDGRTQIFLSVCQGFLPNLNRAPFYCDYIMELENGEPKLHVENTRKAKIGFHLEETLEEAAAKLRSMRGIAFDWGRFDETRAHVESNRLFSQKLEDYGVEHEAEEYSGNPWDKTWTENGRFYSRVLPFLNRHLEFDVIK